MNTDQITDLYNEDELRRLQGYNLAVYHSKNALFLSAGILLISEIIAFAPFNIMPDTFNLILFAGMFTCFVALALWTKRKPYTPLQVGVVIYLIYILVNAIPFVYSNGMNGLLKGLYSGCLYKIVTVILIAKAAPKAKAMQTLNERINQ